MFNDFFMIVFGAATGNIGGASLRSTAGRSFTVVVDETAVRRGGPRGYTQRPWRSMQVSSTSPPSRRHQSSAEKISTSL